MATRAGPPPARLYFTPPSAGGDELPPLAAQVLSAWRGEAEGRRQLSGPEGQLISFRLWEIYDPPPPPPPEQSCVCWALESINQGEVGQSGSALVSSLQIFSALLKVARPASGLVLIDPSVGSFAALPLSLTLANEFLRSL